MTSATATRHDPESACAPLRARFRAADRACLIDEVRLEQATLEHYSALARFHYRAGRPRVVTGGFALVLREKGAVARLLGREQMEFPVGVLLISPPHLACTLRAQATGGRYEGLAQRDAAVMLNREVRCISRVIIDPRFRGLGFASRLVRHALSQHEHAGILYTEALAAMGRVHPVFEKAGMERYDQPPLPVYYVFRHAPPATGSRMAAPSAGKPAR